MIYEQIMMNCIVFPQKINKIFALNKICIKFAPAFKHLLVYGVMVTQLFLVQSFKVRVLVDQQKTSQEIERFFRFSLFDFY